MAITGPSLETLNRQFGEIARGKMKQVLLRNLAEEARLQVVRGFEGERDPYGKAWPPLRNSKRIKRGGNILRKTSRMMNSIMHPKQTPNGLTITTKVAYFAIHNFGGKVSRKGRTVYRHRGRLISERRYDSAYERRVKAEEAGKRTRGGKGYSIGKIGAQSTGIPRRQMLPDLGGRGLGPIWGPAFERVAEQVLKETVRR